MIHQLNLSSLSWTDLAGVSNVYYEIVKPKDDGSPGESAINNTNADNGSYSSFTLSDKGDGRYEFSSEIRDFVNGTNTLIMYAMAYIINVLVPFTKSRISELNS